MDLDLGPEIAEFRTGLREWIADAVPDGLRELADWRRAVIGGSRRGVELAALAAEPAYRAWEERLLDARLICPQWPREFGGQAMDPVRTSVLNEEFHRAGVPRVERGGGESLVGPSLLLYGTEEQKARFLPRIVSGEDTYCQGFSEPDHGSDLASLQTRGVVEGDELVITGQKVWTSFADDSEMMYMLCRTDPNAARHEGISYVLLDFTAAGISHRPIRQMSGASDFSETFLDGVRVPLDNVIGGLGNGWRVAMTTLSHERGMHTHPDALEHEFWLLVEDARDRGRAAEPVLRQRLAWAYGRIQLMRYSTMRTLANLAAGREPGPEASVFKLVWSEYVTRIGDLAMEVRGTDALIRPAEEDYAVDFWQDVFLSGRSAPIFSGSNEIQRNIIGERILGLPREPSS